MRILVAPDKFKGSLGASEVAEAVAAGLRDGLPDAEIFLLPIADGGEGTAEVICAAAGGQWYECEVCDPLGRPVTARFGIIENGATAVMEMSQASGLWRLAPEERDPLRASTFGTGEMLLEAAKRGVREIVIGLGGSATNDGGYGMARALGYRFLNTDEEEIGTSVPDLLHLARIDRPNELSLPRITAAVDVRNPLLGPRGATRVFGPQKGVTAELVATLEDALRHFAEITGGTARERPGSGAAGGLGFGLISFCSADLRSGFDVVAERVGLEQAVERADVVITGEGRLDAQTLEGKGPAGVAQLARRAGKRVYAIAGTAPLDNPADDLFDGVILLNTGDVTPQEAIARASELLRQRARELAVELRVLDIL